jgi:hypothetical protein
VFLAGCTDRVETLDFADKGRVGMRPFLPDAPTAGQESAEVAGPMLGSRVEDSCADGTLFVWAVVRSAEEDGIVEYDSVELSEL